MINKYDFQCPHCNELVKNKSTIVIKTVRSNGDEGEIHLSTTIGNYEYKHIPDVDFEAGELVDFHCIACDKNLISDEFENYIKLKMNVGSHIQFDVLFSRQAGIHKTYIITEDGIETY